MFGSGQVGSDDGYSDNRAISVQLCWGQTELGKNIVLKKFDTKICKKKFTENEIGKQNIVKKRFCQKRNLYKKVRPKMSQVNQKGWYIKAGEKKILSRNKFVKQILF